MRVRTGGDARQSHEIVHWLLEAPGRWLGGRPPLAQIRETTGVRTGSGLAESTASMRCAVLLWVLLSACATDVAVDGAADHDEPADFEPAPADGKADGLPATFDANNVIGDDVFTAAAAMDVADVQAFFERSPYGTRSWLASAQIDGVSAAQAVVDAARGQGIHPLVLVARMQVESTLVSKTVAPSQSRQDHALGCGCPDGSACGAAYRGLDKQLACAAKVLRTQYDASVDGSGEWRKGVAKRTLDPKTVTPATHATASLYAYTPWVLQGTGGTWLVWNVTKKYLLHAEDTGLIH